MLPWYFELILVIVAFISGALVYRNNAKKAEKELAAYKETLLEAKQKVGIGKK